MLGGRSFVICSNCRIAWDCYMEHWAAHAFAVLSMEAQD